MFTVQLKLRTYMFHKSNQTASKIFSLIMLLSGCLMLHAQLPLIPYPAHLQQMEGNFRLSQETKIYYNHPDLLPLTTLFAEKLNLDPAQISLQSHVTLQDAILLAFLKPMDKRLGTEGYKLQIDDQATIVQANTIAGFRYALQTLLQLSDAQEGNIPAVHITDYPRFGYRGLHLDVVRHFIPIEFVYKLLDQMEKHKLNVFHWHLVDDQGWRIEIKKYPKLTETGAWRVDMSDIHWDSRPFAPNEKASYGGYYTQDEIRHIVTYAAERNITIIPEIEMPAHVMSALAAYPELSCTGENLGVAPGGVWPISHIYCAGNDATFDFLEGVLQEVMELFPSSFIHVGGDEADKTEWKRCEKCQKRIQDEGLANEDELQSYFMRRIEKVLNKHGRQMLGWDEILEGGLAPNAAVMSWRGEEGGLTAAQQQHFAVMTPGEYCYLNYYQGDPDVEPLAIGGYTPLRKVYDYEPIPAELTTEKHDFILGAQANLWTEFITQPKEAEYMLFPRLAALAEVVWSPKEVRNWGWFSARMETQYKRYEKEGLNYSMSAFQVRAHPHADPMNKQLVIELSSEAFKPEIRYTLTRKEPTKNDMRYENPIRITNSTQLKAAVFDDNSKKGATMTRDYRIHKAFAAKLSLTHPNAERYDAQGEYGLVDGIFGSNSFSDGLWKGFQSDDMIATLDLRIQQKVRRVEVHTLQQTGSWIYFPTEVIIEISRDGKTFTEWTRKENDVPAMASGRLLKTFRMDKKAQNIRYLRVTARNRGVNPKEHSSAGEPSWIFISEIVVE